MKNIYKALTLLTVVGGFASCNNVAKFDTVAFVSFEGTKITIKEDAEKVEIPVRLEGNEGLSTKVTYRISGGDAVEGKHFNIKDKSGVLEVSAEKPGVIEINPIDSTGILTGNKTITIELLSAVEDEIQLGATKECTLTIIDVDGGINLLVGEWEGSGLKPEGRGDPASLGWTIETCEVGSDEDFPEANIKLVGLKATDPVGNAWEAQLDVYAIYDDTQSEIRIFPGQMFDGGNFGEELGVLYLSLDVESTLRGTDTPVVFSVNEGVMTSTDVIYFALWSESGFSGYSCGKLAANAEIRKK